MTHNPAFLAKRPAGDPAVEYDSRNPGFLSQRAGDRALRASRVGAAGRQDIEQLGDYDVVMWEKHGALAVGEDPVEAFDMIDTLSKSAQIYLTARAMGFEPAGMTAGQMDEMKEAFGL